MMRNLLTTCVEAAVPSGDREQLAQILDEYLQALERGETIRPEDLFTRHPHVADRLRMYLSGLMMFHQAAEGASPHAVWASSGTEGVELSGKLGDFLLVKEIGRGGMGVVYEGVQTSLGRRVALKVLPFSAAIDDKQITRFKNEAQAAAQIDHPNIVPVYAVGHERGIHYFAMQLIGGQSLSQLLAKLREEAEQPLPPTSGGMGRLSQAMPHVKSVAGWGAQTADALHAAHEIGVVHRDIKPSNLLLDEKGKLWVTDFGVARCKRSAGLTETGNLVGTMPYMSPEQASGEAALVDQRTDVYSLGVTLYELATLHHPFEGVGDAALALEGSRSSVRPPRHWNRAIPADFENIILKAMAEHREDRYATAGEMADDLRRFQDDQPILARRPPLSAQAMKWARRHRRSMAAAAGMLALGVLGLVAALIVVAYERQEKSRALTVAVSSRQRAEDSYRQAQERFRQAREVLDRFGARVSEGLASEVPGAERVRRALLMEMLPYYQEFARQADVDPALRSDLATTFSKIGSLSDQLGLLNEAEQAFGQARDVLAALAKQNPSATEHHRNLALCLNNLAQVLQKRGAAEAAREQFEQALALQQRLVDESDGDVALMADLAATHSNLGLFQRQLMGKQDAARHFFEALKIQERLLKVQPQEESLLTSLATTYNNLSSLFLEDEPEAACKWLDKALALQLELVRHYPTRRDYTSTLALVYSNLGTVHSRLSRGIDSERCFRDAITIQKRLVAAAPLVTTYQRDLAVSYNNLGMKQSKASSLSEAEGSFQAALELQQKLVKAHPTEFGLVSALGGIHNNLGLVYQRQGRPSDARQAFELAIDYQRRALVQAPQQGHVREALSKHYYNYARTLEALDRPVEAAKVVLQRRVLWSGDLAKLSGVAEELASLCRSMPEGAERDRYLGELRGMLDELGRPAAVTSLLGKKRAEKRSAEVHKTAIAESDRSLEAQ